MADQPPTDTPHGDGRIIGDPPEVLEWILASPDEQITAGASDAEPPVRV